MTLNAASLDDRFTYATAELAAWIRSEAEATTEALGFGWRPSADAPATYEDLRRAYAHSRATGAPLPVSDAHSNTTIYPDRATNLAFRFWHDATHIEVGRGFTVLDEVFVALLHLKRLEEGYGPSDDARAIFVADTFGQTVYATATGVFPEDHAAFARSSLERGLDHTIRTCVQAAFRFSVSPPLPRVPLRYTEQVQEPGV